MIKRGLLFTGLMLASATNVQALPYGFSDARSIAMGNVSVATGGVTTAAFSNPAMLMVNESNDTFAFHVGAGAIFLDNGDMIDGIDEFQDIEDQINAIDTTDVNNAQALLDALNAQVAVLNDLSGDSLLGRARPNAAVVYGGDSFSLAVTVGADAFASGAISNITGLDPFTLTSIENDINNNTLDLNPTADLDAFGAVTTEVGVSIASSFTLLGMDISLGVKPKVVSAEAITFSESLETVDTEDIIDDTTQDLGSFTTMDAGAVVSFSDSLRVGVVAKNLLSETLTVTTNGSTRDIDFDTHLRVGVAYNNSFMTAAADMDLTETDAVLFEDPTKMLALGVELNAFDYLQLRGGYQTNLASGATADDLISAGIGLWLGFNLDISAVVSGDSVGAFVQTGFRF